MFRLLFWKTRKKNILKYVLFNLIYHINTIKYTFKKSGAMFNFFPLGIVYYWLSQKVKHTFKKLKLTMFTNRENHEFHNKKCLSALVWVIFLNINVIIKKTAKYGYY